MLLACSFLSGSFSLFSSWSWFAATRPLGDAGSCRSACCKLHCCGCCRPVPQRFRRTNVNHALSAVDGTTRPRQARGKELDSDAGGSGFCSSDLCSILHSVYELCEQAVRPTQLHGALLVLEWLRVLRFMPQLKARRCKWDRLSQARALV